MFIFIEEKKKNIEGSPSLKVNSLTLKIKFILILKYVIRSRIAG